MNTITLNHVTYRYREHLPAALDDVSVSFGPGERVCIMGANGSGKTTLVRYLAGLLPNRPDQPHDPGVAFLFQNPDNQMVAVTVDKELAFGLENKAIAPSEIEKRITREAAQFDIISLLSRLTTELSGGEKQRVALASVLIAGPTILILDEPDAFLDQPGREILGAELERIRVQHPGLIELRIAQSTFVARQYPRVILMASGRIIADGPPEQVLPKLPSPEFDPIAFAGLPQHDNGAAKIITVANLSATLGNNPVLTDINLTLTAGRTTCIIGATGSGKSTLGHILAGLIKPSVGSVTFQASSGIEIAASQRSRVITSVLQQPERQFFLPTCAEEIAFGPKNLGLPIDDAIVNLMLQSVTGHSEILAHRDPLTLSAGEKRRLAFAVGLAMATPFIIFDEPTAGLDLSGINAFVALSVALRAAGKGQIIVTHEAGIVRALADDVLVLEAGRGSLFSPSDFFANYPWQRLLSQELILA